MNDARTRKRARRGQQAVMDIGLAAIIATGLGLSYLQITSQDQRTANATSEGRRMMMVGKAAATFVKANQAAIQTALYTGNLCGKAAVGGVVAINPLVDAMPTNATSGGAPGCQTLAGVRLIPNGVANLNGYGQNYNLLLTLRTSPTFSRYVDAKMVTTGPTVADDINGAIAEAMGTAGGIYSSNPNISGGKITGRTGAWTDDPANWAGLITTGHSVVNLAYALHSDVGQGLQRFSDTALDHSGNKLNTSLYMSGLDSATGTGTNIYMNGTGVNQAPANAILGARQVDTATLTNQTPAGVDPNQTSATTGSYTYDDTNANTIRVNANFNITARNRFSVADGMHITANGNTAIADGSNGNGTLPAIIWDNGPNNANAGIGGVALQYDLANASAGGTGYTPMMWVTTYNPKNGNGSGSTVNGTNSPIGSYSYGAMMSSVFWSAEDGNYFIAPYGTRGTIRPAYYASGQGVTPNGATRLGSADFYGVFRPVIPQYGAATQVSHDPDTWNGGVYTVGLYVDGNPYVDPASVGSKTGTGNPNINIADNRTTRVGAGTNQQWNSFMDTEGRSFAQSQVVVGLAADGNVQRNGVNADIDHNMQTAIRNGHLELATAQGGAYPGGSCQVGHTNGTMGYFAHSAVPGDYGALLVCSWNNSNQWTWTRNVSRMTTTQQYRFDDGCGTPDSGAPVRACTLDIGPHFFCALNENIGIGNNANVVGDGYGFLAGPNGNGGEYGGNYVNARGIVQIIEQFINSISVYPTNVLDARGYHNWQMWRGGTLAKYGGGAVCID